MFKFLGIILGICAVAGGYLLFQDGDAARETVKAAASLYGRASESATASSQGETTPSNAAPSSMTGEESAKAEQEPMRKSESEPLKDEPAQDPPPPVLAQAPEKNTQSVEAEPVSDPADDPFVDPVPAPAKESPEALDTTEPDPITTLKKDLGLEPEPQDEQAAVESEKPPPADPKYYQVFWRPFSTKSSAKGFAAHVSKTADVETRVLESGPGKYEVAFAYADDEGKKQVVDRIRAGLGMEIQEKL